MKNLIAALAATSLFLIGLTAAFAQPTLKTGSGQAKSPGLFFPYSNGITINNPTPTIIGKIAQSRPLIKTQFRKEKDPVSGGMEYFLRFEPSKVRRVRVELDGKVVRSVYGFAQYPTIGCAATLGTPISPAACLRAHSNELPPLIFLFKVESPLLPGAHTLRVTPKDGAEAAMTFIIDENLSRVVENIPPPPTNTYDYGYLDANNNCGVGYYYDNGIMHLPLPLIENQNLLYQVSFPKRPEGSQRLVKIKISGRQFDLFFPASAAFFDGKTYIVPADRTFSPDEKPSFEKYLFDGFQALFLPLENLYFENGMRARFGRTAGPFSENRYLYEEFFSVIPFDTTGRLYTGNAMPWRTTNGSWCDG